MAWLIMLSMLLVSSMSGCEMIHGKIHGYDPSPAQLPKDKPLKREQAGSSPAYSEQQKQIQAYREQQKQIQAYREQMKQEEEREKQAEATNPHAVTDPIRGTGEKLLETDLYELYRHTSDSGRCGGYDIGAHVAQVSKVGPEFVLKDDIDYEERFEREILPTLQSRCKLLRSVTVDHYIKGVRIDQWLKEYREDEPMSKDERPLSTIKVEIDAQGKPTWYRMNGYSSLLALRREREVLYPNMAKQEEFENKWKKRAEESAAKQGATVETAEQRLTATTATSDGQLPLSGIDNEHKRLFLMIYDGHYVELSERKDIHDLPSVLYRGVIIRYGEQCPNYLSKAAVTVTEPWRRFVGSEYNPITKMKTDNYEEGKDDYRMEPQYSKAFKSLKDIPGKKIRDKAVSAVNDPDRKIARRRLSPGAKVIDSLETGANLRKEYKERLDKAETALRVMLPPPKYCGKPATIRFMDNLTRYVMHDYPPDVYATPVAETYPYTEKIQTAFIERFYEGVPPTFSPAFPVPTDGEEIVVYLNKNSERPGLKWVRISSLALRDLNLDRTYTKIKLPPDVQQALEEAKYFVVQCTYFDGQGGASLYYWNANGPLPSESVQAYAKNTISEPRKACPVNVSAR